MSLTLSLKCCANQNPRALRLRNRGPWTLGRPGRTSHGIVRWLAPWKVEQNDFGMLLGALENELASVWREVEVANIEVGREVGQGALRACVKVDEPEIFVFNLTLQKHERLSSRQEG